MAFDNPDNTADTFAAAPLVTGEGEPVTVTAPTKFESGPNSIPTVDESKFAFTTPATVAPVNPTSETDPVVTAGAAIKVYPPDNVSEPPGVVTTTSTTPTAWLGVTPLIDVGLITAIDVAGAPSKVMADAPVNPVPVIVNAVPPPEEPEASDIALTVGTGSVVIGLEVADANDVPALFVAVTVNVYKVPGVNPLTVIVPEPA